jgi:hypothetical protein
MKSILLTIVYCWLGTTLFSQVTQRNILSSTYNLTDIQTSLIPKSQWKPYPISSKEWVNSLADTVLKTLIASGEQSLKYNFEPISGTISMDFKRSGDRERHGNISFSKRQALMNLVLAESIEDKGRFTEAILNGVWSICEESFWGVPAHISGTGLPDVENPVVELFSAETAAVLGLTDYFTGEKLDKINPLIRKRIYFETNKRIFQPLLTQSDKYGWMSKTKPVNNWNPWIMSNWILSNLLLEKDESKRATMIYAAMSGLDAYLNSLGDDGGCDEGPSYWFAAGGSVYDCLELLQSSTKNKVNIYNNPLIRNIASYVVKTHIDGNYFVNFADADPTLRPDGLMLYRFGNAINDEQLKGFARWAMATFPNFRAEGNQRMRQLQNALMAGKLENDTNSYKPLPEAWISDIQEMTARTPNGLFLAAHGGHNAESHNHNDVGDFIIYVKGQPMIIDAGRGNYTARTFSNQRYQLWFTRSDHHNLPIINGQVEQEGREFKATDVKFSSDKNQVQLDMNIAEAYPQAAGIQSWKRNISLNRLKEKIIIKDEGQFTQNLQSLQQVFMTVCEVSIPTPGKIVFKNDSTILNLQYDPKKWTITTDNPSTEGMEYKSFKTKWKGKPVTRVIFTLTKLDKNPSYTFTFDTK